MQFLYPLLFLAPLAVSTPIVRRQLATSDTQNDLVNGSPCKALTIIFARGTVEAGNVGARVGPPLFVAVANLIGEASLAVQGVDYSADIFGFLVGGSTSGSTKMKTLHSQGAQLVHNAASQFTAAETAKINSVVVFGDPKNGTAVGTVPASKTLVICHKGDNICEHGIIVSDPHLNYSNDAPTAASFIVQQANLA
ncbi:putative cutinase [Bisporella sp. PMI_857]|nr:putative cutinase [Bisporella sp. PMI_857]